MEGERKKRKISGRRMKGKGDKGIVGIFSCFKNKEKNSWLKKLVDGKHIYCGILMTLCVFKYK